MKNYTNTNKAYGRILMPPIPVSGVGYPAVSAAMQEFLTSWQTTHPLVDCNKDGNPVLSNFILVDYPIEMVSVNGDPEPIIWQNINCE